MLLTAGALALAAGEACKVLVRTRAEHAWFFFDAEGAAAYGLAGAQIATLLVIAYGLWRLRGWARWAGMGYLCLELATFLLLGAGGWGHFFGVHILLVPCATFGLMYLQRGAADFDQSL